MALAKPTEFAPLSGLRGGLPTSLRTVTETYLAYCAFCNLSEELEVQQNPKSNDNLPEPSKEQIAAPSKLHVLPTIEPPSHEKRTVVVHNFQWHLIVKSLALLIFALAAVASQLS